MTQRPSHARLENLRELWRRERATSRERFLERLGQDTTLKEREARGVALRDLAVDDLSAAPGGRVRVWMTRRGSDTSLDQLRIGVGDPVRLWHPSDDEETTLRGVIARKRSDRMAVVVDELPEVFEQGGFRLELVDDEATFKRGFDAIERLQEAPRGSDVERLRELVLGERTPEFRGDPPRHTFDDELNGPQREAAAHAMAALDLALIHGPPGTGKTRTLVEVVRRAVAAGETVLATAPSNTAVDNLGERLVDAGLRVVRLGHPARVDKRLEAQTLDAWLERSPTYPLAKSWMQEARAIRRRVDSRTARGRLDRRERREMLDRAWSLMRDARKQLRAAQALVLDSAQVICTTCAGAASRLLGRREFDLVVIDEATQAPDPIAFVPMLRGRRWVLAGDPCQLPPTIIDPEAQRDGLGETLFERLAARDEAALRMLVVQHRMHSELMAFPSESMYEGRLRAAEEVAQHRLTELPGVIDDPLRPGALIFVDTAGKGWDEAKDPDRSTYNTEQALRVASEARRLVERGIAARHVAVISPYRAQVSRLRDALAEQIARGLEVDTIDAFQGREKEAIVIDLVRSNPEGQIGFLGDIRRMNVAVTRARRHLVVVGDSATIGQHPYYAGFLDAVEVLGTWLSAWDT